MFSNINEVFKRSLYNHLMTVGFLKSLKENLGVKKGFKIAADAFANYMIEYHKIMFGDNMTTAQNRFDFFRKQYKKSAKKTVYLKIVESNSDTLRVKYTRCPFHEVVKRYNLSEFSTAFCQSDYAFTKELLPGVEFSRSSEIAKGGSFCDHTWRMKCHKN